MGAARNVALSELNFRGINLNPVNTNTVNMVASDSGVIFINKNTGGDTNYVLPAVADCAGKMFWFFNGQTTKNMVITAPSAIMMGDDTVTGTTATTVTNNCGFAAMVIGDGTNFFLFEFGALAWTVG